MNSNELLTIEEVAKMVRVSERTIYNWAQKGEIPAGRLGTAWRFRKSEIISWIDKQLKSKKKQVPDFSIKLSSVLTQDRVVFIEESTKVTALHHLVSVLATSDFVHNEQDLLDEIYKREKLMSTGIGQGIAIPHSRLNSVDDLAIAVGICKNPLEDYDSLDGKPVSIIIMIAANSGQHAKHIKTLSTVTKILTNDSNYQAIISAKDEKEVYELLLRSEL